MSSEIWVGWSPELCQQPRYEECGSMMDKKGEKQVSASSPGLLPPGGQEWCWFCSPLQLLYLEWIRICGRERESKDGRKKGEKKGREGEREDRREGGEEGGRRGEKKERRCPGCQDPSKGLLAPSLSCCDITHFHFSEVFPFCWIRVINPPLESEYGNSRYDLFQGTARLLVFNKCCLL